MLGAAPVEAQLISPGALSRAHASLEGDTRCGECHASGRGVEASLCNECHADVAASVRAGRGLHGRRYRGQACERCHVEHRGAGAALVRWPGGAREGFDHALTGWPLRDAHTLAACGDCHRNRNSRGASTFIGASSACRSCHEDPHGGRFGTDCGDCHRETSFTDLSLGGFDHSVARFPLRGEHRDVSCAGCHGEPPRFSGIPFGECSSCHRDPHGGRLGADCNTCHDEAGWQELTDMRGRHPGLSLGGGHGRVDCARCHDRGLARTPSRGDDCADCHAPVHEADLGRDCGSCHGAIRWLGLPRSVGLASHTRTPFPLSGAHADAECAGCHRPELPRHERYTALVFDGCSSCHADPHGGALADHDGGDCAGCHSVAAFRPSTFGVAGHAQTPFPLDGRHTAVACAGCHETAPPRVDFHVGGFARCESCHESPHGDQFAAEMAAGGCASCHRTTGWEDPVVDHSSWPLTGAHAGAACERCHSPSAADRRAGRGASYRGVPRVCQGCHADPHAGQFRLSQPVRGCETCHSTAAFEIEPFDHEARADFALTGAHRALACASCHGEERLRNGDEVVRYRLGYRDCSDCHADPHAGGPR